MALAAEESFAFEYLGEVDRAGKILLLQSSHLLSVPTAYHEAKGFYVLEALAASPALDKQGIRRASECCQGRGREIGP